MRRRDFLIGLLLGGCLAVGGQVPESEAKKGRDDVRNEPSPGGLDSGTDDRARHDASSSNSGSGSSGSGSSGSGSGSDDGYNRGESSGSGHDGSERGRGDGRSGKLRNAKDDLDRF